MLVSSQKVLWLGNLPKELDTANDIVFSAVTFGSRERALLDYANRGLLTASESSSIAMAEAETMTRLAFREVALPIVSRMLIKNDVPEFSETALSVLMAPWLMFLLHTCWLNYRILEQHIEVLGDERTVVVVPTESPFSTSPSSSSELVNLMINREFHAWLASVFLRLLVPPNWTTAGYVPDSINQSREIGSPFTDFSEKIRLSSQHLLARGRCTTEQLTPLWRVIFSAMLSLRKIAVDVHPQNHSTPSQESGAKLPEPFVRGVISILEKCTPTFFQERFAFEVKRICHRHKFRKGYGRIVGGDIFDDSSNLIKALAYDAGEVLLSVQHGGGFGTHKIFPLSPESEYLGGAFITWGWEQHNTYPVEALPLPSPSLSRLRDSRERAHLGKDIVFVGGDMNPAVLRVHSKPVGEQWLAYRAEKLDFLGELSGHIFDAVTYRGYFTGTLRDDDFLLQSFPKLRLINGKSRRFHRKLITARLCVVDHPITTLHQVLAMNIPTIAYWNHNHWDMCAQAAPYFSDLERVGIVHRSGKEAGRFLDRTFGKIETWWTSSEVQEARMRWCDRYARVSDHWTREWIDMLWRRQERKPASN